MKTNNEKPKTYKEYFHGRTSADLAAEWSDWQDEWKPVKEEQKEEK